MMFGGGHRRLFLQTACGSILAAAGCSPWIRSPNSGNLLPKPPLSEGSVVLEIAYVHLSVEERPLEQRLWQSFDEQVLPFDLRHRLTANGLRAGLLGQHFPDELRQLLDRTVSEGQQAPTGDSVTSGENGPSLGQRRLQLQPGKRAKIVCSATIPSLSILTLDDEKRIHGQHFDQAQCLLSVKVNPEGSGTTKVELIPEIEHGEVKNRWVPVDGALVQQIGKEREVYEQLRMNARLSPGQTLVLGATPEPCGLGSPFFTVEQPTRRRVLVLIRLAQVQQDELFSPHSGRLEISSASDQ